MWILFSATAWLVGILWLFSLEQLPDLGWSPATVIASALVL